MDDKIELVENKTFFKHLVENFSVELNKKASWFGLSEKDNKILNDLRIISKDSSRSTEEQCKALLSILYQWKQTYDSTSEHLKYKLMIELVNVWLTQGKPDGAKIQTVINYLLNNGLINKTNNNPKIIQFIKDLLVIGAQVAYYRDNEKKLIRVVRNPKDDANDPEKELLQNRQRQLRFFLHDVSSTITDKKRWITQRETINAYTYLEKTLEEIKLSKANGTLNHLPVQVLFQHSFSSEIYNARKFKHYLSFIKNWLAHLVDKDQVDEIFLLHLLHCGIEQVSKERESVEPDQGYKPFSTAAKKFMEFLTEIHQQYGLPNELKLQELKEEIAIRQAKLLDSISHHGEVFSLMMQVIEIANSCVVPDDKEAAFDRRLFEVAIEKCSSPKAHLLHININEQDFSLVEHFGCFLGQGMKSNFLEAYFSYCTTFADYQRFAEFMICKTSFCEPKAVSKLSKQLSEKLTVSEYEALTQKLIEYAVHKRKPTHRLEHFLFSGYRMTSPLLITLLKMENNGKYRDEILIKVFKTLKDVILLDNLMNAELPSHQLIRTKLTIPCIELLHAFYEFLKATESYDNSIEYRLIDNAFYVIINNISTAGEMISFIAFLYDLAKTHQKAKSLKNFDNNVLVAPFKTLNLSGVALTDKEFTNLANLSINYPYLETISLNKNQLSNSSSKALIKLLHAAPFLTALNITGNLQLGAGIFQNSRQLPALPALTQLDISHNGLNHEAMGKFLLWLKQSPSLRALNLSDNVLGSRNFSSFSQYFSKPGAVFLASQLAYFSQLKTLIVGNCELNITDIKLLARQLAQKPAASIQVQNNLLNSKDVRELMELWEIGKIGNIITTHKKAKKNNKEYLSVIEGFIDDLFCKLECYHTGNQAISSGLVKRCATEPYERALKIAKKLIKAVPVVCHLADGIDALHHLGKTVAQIKKMSRVWQFATALPMLKEIKHELQVMIHGKEGTPKERAKYYARFFIGQAGREMLEHFIEEVRHYYKGPIEKCAPGSELLLAKSVFEHLKLGMLAMKQHNELPKSVGTFLLNWLMWVDLILGKVTLKTGEEIAIAHLFHYAGFMCRDEQNKEVFFDMQIKINDKIFRTDGARYGYRIADQRIVDELSMQLKAYSEGAYQQNFNFDEATLQLYQDCQLQIIPVDCQCYGIRLDRTEGEIKKLKETLETKNEEINKLKEGLSNANEKIRDLTGRINTLTTFAQQNRSAYNYPVFAQVQQQGESSDSEVDNEPITTQSFSHLTHKM